MADPKKKSPHNSRANEFSENGFSKIVKMKKLVLILSCVVIFCSSAMAQDSGFGLSLGYGCSQDNIDIYRVGLIKKWHVNWLENKIGYIDGFFELSCNRWRYRGENITAFALSPVFQYAFNPNGNTWYPYIEVGIGVSYLDEYLIRGRNLSSNFQFEDRVGVGFRFGDIDLNFRFMHYSNASLKEPNFGIDIWIGTLAYSF